MFDVKSDYRGYKNCWQKIFLSNLYGTRYNIDSRFPILDRTACSVDAIEP